MELICVKSNNFVDILKKQCDTILQGIKANRHQIVVVPNGFVNQVEFNIMEKLKLEATFFVQVCEFDDILEVLNFEYSSISQYEKCLLMQKALFECKSELLTFKQTSISIAKMLMDAIDKFRVNCITIPQIEAIIPSVSKSLFLKLHDIVLCWKRIEGSLCDKNKNLFDFLKNSKDNLEHFDFIFWGFDDFSLLQKSIIENLLKRAHSVCIATLVSEDNQPNKDTFPGLIKNFVKALSTKFNIEVKTESCICSLPDWSRHLLTNLTAANLKRYELNTPCVRVYSATNIKMEVEFLAQEILETVKMGRRYKDCFVLCSSLETYAPFIELVFTQYNIPFEMDKEVACNQVDCIKFLKICFDCVSKNFESADIIKCVHNSFSRFSIDEINQFCEVMNMFNLSKDNFQNIVEPKFQDDKFDYFLILRDKLGFLLNFSNNINSSSSVSDFINSVKQLIIDSNLENNIFSELDRKAYNKFINCLDKVDSLMGALDLNFDEFNEIVFSGLNNIIIHGEMTLDKVKVAKSTLGEQVPYLFALGAYDGAFPSFKSDVAILDDSDLSLLDEFGISLPSVMMSNLQAKCEVVKNLCCATQSLMISYPIHIGAEKCEPASVVDDCLKCFTFGGNALPNMFLGEVLNDDLAFGGEEERLSRLWQLKNNMLFGFVHSLTAVNKVSESIEASCYARVNEIYAKELSIILKLLGKNLVVTSLKNPMFIIDKGKLRVTQIEKFFECPYAHFVSYGLSPYEKKSHRPSALDIGNIIHSVLEQFGRMLIKNDPISNLNEAVSRIFDNAINNKEYNHLLYGTDNQLFFKELKQETLRACKTVLYQLEHGEYKLKFVEASFGNKDFAPIPKVEIDGKNVAIVGKVDRVDGWNNRLRIIDYKSSKTSGKFSLQSFYLGKKIQLLYYMKVLVDSGYQPGGAYYMPVHREYYSEDKADTISSKFDGVSLYTEANMFAQDDQVCFEHPSSDIVKFDISVSKTNQQNGSIQLKANTNGANEVQFSNLLNYAKLVLTGAVADLLKGEIRPYYVGNVCDFCKFRYICRKGVNSSVRERRSDFSIKLDSFSEVADEI